MVKNYPTLKKLVPLFLLLFSIAAFSQTSQTFTTSGIFTVPAGVTQVTVEAWGGGGRGGPGTQSGAGGSGAGGGAYAKKNIVTVSPGNTYSVTVGIGSIANNIDGGDSYFINNTTLLAKGGKSVPTNIALGGLGGAGTSSIGDVVLSGGNGVKGIDGPGNSGKDFGGGGGSSAGTLLAGTTATNQNGAIAPAGGGNGGNGGEYDNLGNGGNGSIPGGGGGGALWGYHPTNGTVYYGGNGANGQIIIRWTCPTYSLTSPTIVAPICVNTGAVVTLNSNPINLPIGTYTVTYNQSAPNLVTGATKTMTVTTAGTGSFTTNNLASPGTTTITITNLASGSGSPNCSSAISSNNTAIVTVTAIPATPGTITQPTNKCSGSNGNTFSISAVSGASSYTWSVTGTGWAVTAGGTTTSATITVGTGIGTVSVTATNGCGTSAASTTGNITPTIIPATPGTITQPTNKCSGSTGNTFSISAVSGASSYTWSVTGTGWAVTAGGTTTSATITVGTGIGAVSVTATNGCGTSAASTTGNITPTILAAPTTTNASICSGSSVTLAASGAVATQFYKWYSLETGGALLKTGTDNTDNTYVTPAITATTDYWVSIVNSNGCESVRTKVTAFVNVNNIWNGSADINWNNAANWCIGVPTFGVANTLDVLIPSGLTNYPVIYSGAVSGYVKTLVLENNTTLNVRENSLRVTHNLRLNGNSKIDFEGESQLLQDIGSVFDAASTGTIEIDQQGEGNKYRYNYWSIPVYTGYDAVELKNYTTIFASLRDGTVPSSLGIITFNNSGYDGALTTPITLSTYWMYKYLNSGNGYSAWNQVRSTGYVYTGQGFTMKGSGAPGSPQQNYTFVGKPNNGTINLTVAANYDYLVGNPYPSAIDADQFLSDNSSSGTASITGAIYFWEHYGGDTHNLTGYQGGYATYSLGGGVQASAFPGLGGGISVKLAPKRYIPVGQAFFVVGDALDGGQIQFNNGQRVFEKESDGYSIFMKNSNTKAKTENTRGADLRPKFRIGFDAPKISHRQLLLTIDEKATQDVDWGYEAEIYEIFADDIYWMLNNKKYVIQATNDVGLGSEVPLGIQLSKTGAVTVKIDALENVDENIAVYLKDKLTGESFNMKDKPVQLNLVVGKYPDRFAIIFKMQKLMAEDVDAEAFTAAEAQPIIEGIHVYMNNAIGELQIKNNSDEEITSIALYNYLGQTVKTWNSNFNIRTISLPISTATGVYLVQINTKTGKAVKKISVE